MNTRTLTETQLENLMILIDELQSKVKKKQEQLTSTRRRLSNAKKTIQRLQSTVNFQQQRILDLHKRNPQIKA